MVLRLNRAKYRTCIHMSKKEETLKEVKEAHSTRDCSNGQNDYRGNKRANSSTLLSLSLSFLCVSTAAVVQEDKDKKYAEICPGVIVRHSAVKTIRDMPLFKRGDRIRYKRLKIR